MSLVSVPLVEDQLSTQKERNGKKSRYIRPTCSREGLFPLVQHNGNGFYPITTLFLML